MGDKTPEPPPDYTKERAAFAQSEYANRQREAAAYNEAINRYNSQLGRMTSNASSIQNSLKGLNISNDEMFGTYQSQLDALNTHFNTLEGTKRGTMAAPSWSSVVQSAYGPVEVGIPKLYTRSDPTGFSSALSSSMSALDNLRQQRTAEEQRIDNYVSQLSSGYENMNDQIGRFTIADVPGINSMQGQLSSAMAGINSFNSLIKDEYKPSWQNEYTSKIDAARASLAKLLEDNAAEQKRIRDYEAGINSNYDAYNSRFGGLTIANESDMADLQRLIDDQQTNAGRFSSLLGFDFSQELSPFQDLETKLGGLRSQREAELSRVEAAQNAAKNGMASIMSQIGGADIYNLGILQQLQSAIDQGQSDISGFSSLLPVSWGDIPTQLEAAEGDLEGLLERRNAALATFGSRAGGLMDRVNGLANYNEGGFNLGLTDAQRLMSELSRFSGNDIGDERDAIQAVIDRIQGRVGELGVERGNIENEARGLLTNAQGSEYTSKAAIDALADQLKALTGRSTQMGASQAQDELDALVALISGERGRLDEEAAAALARQQQEQAAMAGYVPSGNSFGSYYTTYNPWVGNRGRGVNQLPTSFARQLGVVYA